MALYRDLLKVTAQTMAQAKSVLAQLDGVACSDLREIRLARKAAALDVGTDEVRRFARALSLANPSPSRGFLETTHASSRLRGDARGRCGVQQRRRPRLAGRRAPSRRGRVHEARWHGARRRYRDRDGARRSDAGCGVRLHEHAPGGGAQPSGTLGAGFRAPTLTTTTTEVNNGFALVQVTKDSSNYYRADLQLVFTDYVACGYAKADLAKENHLFGDIVMWRNQSGTPPAPFTAGSYKSSLDPQADAGAPAGAEAMTIFVNPPMKYTKDACPGTQAALAGTGHVRIDEINDTHVRGEAHFASFEGAVDLPVCNYPFGDLKPHCGCAP